MPLMIAAPEATALGRTSGHLGLTVAVNSHRKTLINLRLEQPMRETGVTVCPARSTTGKQPLLELAPRE